MTSSVGSVLWLSVQWLIRLIVLLVVLAVLALVILQYTTPTSSSLALQSQDKLLTYFLKQSHFEVKSTPVHGLNYVIIHRKDTTQRSKQSTSTNSCGSDSDDELLNKTTSCSNDDINSRKHQKVLIITHGYASGLGFFFENFDALAQHYDVVIGVDWLGMGCSCRHRKPVSRSAWYHHLFSSSQQTLHELTTQVIDEFLLSLEELRQIEHIDKFVLAGHSLGGYLSGNYAMKYPQHLEGLILASPAGLPELPEDEHRVQDHELNWKYRAMKWLFWHVNISPQLLIRLTGFTGPQWMEKVLKRRFGDGRWTTEASKLIYDYAYHITAAPGNGEYCLSLLLQPVFVKNIEESIASDETISYQQGSKSRRRQHKSGVFARKPLENKLISCSVPILLLFGDRDWMHYPDVQHTVALWKQHGVHAELAMIPNAGHLLYFENAKQFNQAIVDWSHKVIFAKK